MKIAKIFLPVFFLMGSVAQAGTTYGYGGISCDHYTKHRTLYAQYESKSALAQQWGASPVPSLHEIGQVKSWISGYLTLLSDTNGFTYDLQNVQKSVAEICAQKPQVRIKEALLESLRPERNSQ